MQPTWRVFCILFTAFLWVGCADTLGDLDDIDATPLGDVGVPDGGFPADIAVESDVSDPEREDAEPTSNDAGIHIMDMGDGRRPDPDSGMPPPENICTGDFPCATEFPARFEGDTNDGMRQWGNYPCKASANEGGPELLYEVIVTRPGFLTAAVYDDEGTDVDVHILDALNPDACLARGHHHARADVEPGRYFIVVDSFVSAAGEQAGAFTLDVGHYEPSIGPCDVDVGVMPRVGDGGDSLRLPATGPMVLEAHLVTANEPAPFPETPTDQLTVHYALTQALTGFVMHRNQDWAPLEGGSFYGAGIGPARLLPVVDEAWYVCMYWRSSARPDRGARIILRVPGTNRAVVAAAGHETGPGNLDFIGGTTEETHFYLDTGHRGEMNLGIATDQTLPFGPRVCTD